MLGAAAAASADAQDAHRPSELASEIEAARSFGFAVAEEEYVDGVSGVAVPVMFEAGRPRAAIGVVGPSSRIAGSSSDRAARCSTHLDAAAGAEPTRKSAGRIDGRADRGRAAADRHADTEGGARDARSRARAITGSTCLADLDGQVPLWDGAIDGSVEPAEILDGYRSTVDWPGGYFYSSCCDSPRRESAAERARPRALGAELPRDDRRHVLRRVADPPAVELRARRSTRSGGVTWSSSTGCSGASRARSPPGTRRRS